MSILPFLYVHHIGQYNFAVKLLFEFSVVFSKQITTFTFQLHDYNACSGIQKIVTGWPHKGLCDCLINYTWGHDWLALKSTLSFALQYFLHLCI